VVPIALANATRRASILRSVADRIIAPYDMPTYPIRVGDFSDADQDTKVDSPRSSICHDSLYERRRQAARNERRQQNNL
jgi:hypothetical protein